MTGAKGFKAPLFIAGQFTSGKTDSWLASVDPSNEKPLGSFAVAEAVDVDRAVEAAHQAYPAWSALPDAERAARLENLASAIEARTDQIVELEALDTGNTIGRLAKDVSMSTASIRYFAGLIPRLNGETTRSFGNNLHLSIREPYGVVARIVPFNHPFMFAAARIAAPLAAGNAVVIKTAEQSPLSSALLAEACAEALPPGVVNIVHGLGMPTGDALVRHSLVKRIGFTGSVPTGRVIQRAAAEAGIKHVSLELGGKNPMVICSDVDPDRAAQVAVGGMNFAWAGQSCGSTSRVLIHASIYDEVVRRVSDIVDDLVVGHPLDRASQMGPVNSAAQLRKVQSYIEGAIEDGARLCAGGSRPEGAAFERGFWIRPTVFADVDPGMRIAQEEIFGPVVALMRWTDEDEAIRIANGTDYGLTGSIWTNDINRAVRFARRVEAGYIWINGSSVHIPGLPFAGKRNSGVGSEETLEELLSYTETKSISFMVEH